MKKSTIVSMMFSLVILLLTIITIMGDASAQSLSSSLGVVTYPSKGQTAEQQSKDEGECFAWSKEQLEGQRSVPSQVIPEKAQPQVP